MPFDLLSASRRLSFQIAFSLLACVAALAPDLTAQTAHFSYAMGTLGGGFSQPGSVAVDGKGNVYVADYSNGAVKMISSGCVSSACVTTLGGGFATPTGVAVDTAGNIYVADPGHTAVEEMGAGCISSSCVTTLGGGFSHPVGVTVDGGGRVYVADFGSNAVKRMSAGCASSACVTTLGGGFNGPVGVAVGAGGKVYVADKANNAVKEIPAGCVTSACVTTLGGGFSAPEGVAVDASDAVYVGDYGNNAVKEIPAACVSSACVIALGGGFNKPAGVAAGANGNVYVADSGHNAVKEVMLRGVNLFSAPVGAGAAGFPLTFSFTSAGTIRTPVVLTQGATGLDFTDAGTGTCTTIGAAHTYAKGDTCTVNVRFGPKYAGTRYGAVVLKRSSGTRIATALVWGTGVGPQVVFNPSIARKVYDLNYGYAGIAVDGSGDLYEADWEKAVVEETPRGCKSSACLKVLDGGFLGPEGVALDGAGNLYVADAYAVKEMPAGCVSSSCVMTLGGGFTLPSGIAVDSVGNVYVSETDNSTNGVGDAVKEIPVGCASSACVKTLGGGFYNPQGVAVDVRGNVYVADSSEGVKEMPAGCASPSCVTTLFAGIYYATALALDGAGNIYVIDAAIYEIPAGCASSSCVTLFPDDYYDPLDDQNATDPTGIALDGAGNIYLTDALNGVSMEVKFDTPYSLKFENTLTGFASRSNPNTVGINNIGNAGLTIPRPSTGTNPSLATGFTLDSSSTCPQLTTSSASATLAAGANCNYAIDFEPTAVGSYSGSLALTDNTLNAIAPSYVTQAFTLSGASFALPSMSSPAPGSVLSGASVAFTWTGPPLWVNYRLDIGTTGPGSADVYQNIDGPDGWTVTNIPTNGAWLYVRLYYQFNGVWNYLDYKYTEAGTPTAPALTTPAPGSTLSGSGGTFTWSPGAGPRSYMLKLGTKSGGYDIYNGAASLSTSADVSGIPTNGVWVYARLYYKIDDTWQYIDYKYTEK